MTVARFAPGRLAAALPVLAGLALSGCASTARIDNPADAACQRSAQEALSGILAGQGEPPSAYEPAVAQIIEPGHLWQLSSRPFVLRTASAADYGFFVGRDGEACVLRLFMRARGNVRYTNNLTWIDTRQLSGCRCTP